MKKNKYKYLIGNTGLLTISNFGSKILSFFLIPLYTNILTTTEYGVFDIYSTTISLLIPILTLNIYEAVIRFGLEKADNKKDVFTVGVKYTFISIGIMLILITLNKLFNIFPIINEFYIYFILIFIGEAIYTFLIKFCRGIEKILESAIAGVINSISIITFNILCLCVWKMELSGYFFATMISYFVAIIYLILSTKIWRFIKVVPDKTYERKMIKYSRPLIFDTISWWIINVSDRYIITYVIGTAANGIYSMAYKIPSVLNVFQSIFNQAWTISAVKEYEDNSKEFYSTIYKLYNMAMMVTCSALILIDKIIAKILFAKDFYIAWKYAPFLMVSVVFGALSGLLGGIFNAAKESKILSKTTFIGCIINIMLNILLVPLLGIIGAALSTLLAYIIVWALRIHAIRKLKELNINIKRDFISYMIVIIQAVLMFFSSKIWLFNIIQTILFIAIIVLYFKEIKLVLEKLARILKSRLKKGSSIL